MGILVVDDSEEGRSVFEAVLMASGYQEVITVDSAASALSLLAVGAPTSPPSPVDLIILDAVMPDIDGFEACKRIREDSRYAEIPIVIATSLDDIESVESAFKAGATDYLSKPLKRVDLLACVRASLELKAERERRNETMRELLQHKPFQF